MNAPAQVSRRAVSRELSRIANASVRDVLNMPRSAETRCRRIGVTGPPGAGKSTLVAGLVSARLKRPGTVAVVAIDPSSPVSGGAILGDRIRMENLATDPRVYIRSLASRGSHDGLADNLPDILEVFERAGFVELVVETVGVETVGVGQVEYEIQGFVDTTLLVLMPGAGDQIQAMKSGSIERADILVVNKADQPGAKQLVSDLKAVLERGRSRMTDWTPPIVLTSVSDAEGFEQLGAEIDRHQEWLRSTGTELIRAAEHRCRHAASLLKRRIDEILAAQPRQETKLTVAEIYADVVDQLVGPASAEDD